MQLHGVSASPFVRKARIVLEEKGVAYAMAPPAPHLHPLGKMPVLVDGDVVVPDSSAIAAYLERLHPQPALYPDAPRDLAHALVLEEYGDTRMAEGMGLIVFERIVKPSMLGQPTDSARLESYLTSARQRWFGAPTNVAGAPIPCVADYLEGQLRDSGAWLLGAFGIADIAIGAHLGWLVPCGLELDAARWPRLAAYAARVEARPSFRATSD